MRAKLPYLDDVIIFMYIKFGKSRPSFTLSPSSRSKLKERTNSHPNHQSAYTHPPSFSKSHYDVIQVGQFCTHAGSKKNTSVLLRVTLNNKYSVSP